MPQIQKAPSKPRADELIQLQEQGVSARKPFESLWQNLHDYFYVESADVDKTYTGGSEIDPSFLWDGTTLECADVFASGFMNYLTPPSSSWFRLRHRNPALQENRDIRNFLEDVSAEVNSAFNRSNFYDQMFPAYKMSGVYGTAPLFVEEDLIDDVRFSSLPLKQTVIMEDARGRVTKYFFEFEYNAEQAAGRWGMENLTTEMQEEIRQGKGETTKHKFILFIGERYARDHKKSDKKNMPVEAIWIDVKGRKTMEESGYNEFPAFCHRFDKRPFVPWGFSPAMKAMPFARLLNAIAKTNLRTMMKHTDPPMAVPHNAFLAPLNMNPRAVNVYKKSSMDSAKEMFPFGNYGNPEIGFKGVEFYSMNVKTMMFHDVFLAFNNITKEMNNPEIMERVNEKMTMLGPAVGRYLDEAISPIIQRVIGVLARRGKLPTPPPEMLMNPGYEIDFVGILANAQRRTELNNLVTGLSMIGNLVPYAPDVMDKINTDKTADEIWEITGSPGKVLRSDSEIAEIREGRAEAAAQQAQLAQLQVGGQIAKDVGSAKSSLSKSNAEDRKQ